MRAQSNAGERQGKKRKARVGERAERMWERGEIDRDEEVGWGSGAG